MQTSYKTNIWDVPIVGLRSLRLLDHLIPTSGNTLITLLLTCRTAIEPISPRTFTSHALLPPAL